MKPSSGSRPVHPVPAPVRRAGIWIRNNLFSSPLNILLTLGASALLLCLAPEFLRWALWDADWSGNSRDACSGEGACWVFVGIRLNQFLHGFYPPAEQWRVYLVLVLLPVALLPFIIQGIPHRTFYRGLSLVTFPLLAIGLLAGGVLGLVPVETSRWGGLMLTLVIATTGIAAALPLGIFLALGRRSSLPVVRLLSASFIEVWRGVPLITVLFMASVMLPLFLPEGVTFSKLLRAIIGIILFESAYMAEVVRGGLQALPEGQIEAARSLGLGYWRTTGLIVLPQALRHVIPGIVNTLIALFKDTALVLVIGLFDLLAVVQTAFKDPQWLGFAREGYVFAGLIYWLFCFSMSRYSQRLERRLAEGR